MIEKGGIGLKDRVWSLFFPKRPKVSNLMFHIHSDRPVQVNQRLLLEEEIGQINSALRRVDICSSVDALNRRLGVDEIDRVVFSRASRFINNYVQTRVLAREGGYQPRVMASEDSGIYNALVAAEAISLEAALDLVAKESRALAIARGAYGKDIFTKPDIPLRTSLIEPYLGDFNSTLASTIISEPKIKLVGGSGSIMATAKEIRLGIISQTIEPSNEQAVRITLKRLGISKPHEIGLNSAEGDNKYLTIAAAAFTGAGMAAAILGVIVHKRRQKAKKV